jgi:hypothetical protein
MRTLIATARRRRAEIVPLLRAAVLIPMYTLELRLLGARRLTRHRVRSAGTPAGRGMPRPGDGDIARARRMQRLVEIAAHHGVTSGSCLSRSLTLLALLERAGIEGELRIGVSSPAREFAAHAWVEHRGVVLNDGDDVDRRYTPIGAMPARDAGAAAGERR